MPLSIALDSSRASAGDIVRGTVHGIDARSDARGAVVALVHQTEHMDQHEGLEVRLDLNEASASSLPFDIAIPRDAPPSFEGCHYGSAWRLEVRVDRPHRRDEKVSRPLVVLPAREHSTMPAEPVTGAAPGPIRFRVFAAVFLVADLVALAALYVAFGAVPPLVALAFVVPALATLAALAWIGLRPGVVERLEVTVPRARWRFGEVVAVRVEVVGEPGGFEALEVGLRGEEVWVESAGKATHVRRVAFHEDVHRLTGPDIAAARSSSRRWSWDSRFLLPATGPLSRAGAIEWAVRVRASIPRRPDPVGEVALEVAGSLSVEQVNGS